MNEYDEKYWKDRPMEQKFIVDVLHWLQWFNPKSAFIHGAGMGYRVHCFEYFGVKSSGIDISEHAIKNSYGLAKGKIKKSWPKEKFDLVISYDVFEHLKDKDVDIALKNLHKTCGKYFLFGITSKDNPNFPLDKTHINSKSMIEWSNIIEKNGFKIKQTPKKFPYWNQILMGEKN